MKKNIAILIPKLAGGGAERAASNLSLHLDNEKYNKYVIVYNSNDKDYSYEGQMIDLDAVAISNPFGKIYNFFKRIYKLKKVKKKYDIDATISFLSGPNLVNILSKENDKVIVSVRSFISKNLNGFYGNLHKFLIKKFYNKADKIISVSDVLKKDLKNEYGISEEKIKVIYNNYDIDSINKMSNETIETKYKDIFNKPTIINMGRLTEAKGQWHLIRAFSKVKEEVKDAQLVILGKGELENYLKKLTLDYGLEKDIHFLGFKNNPFKYIANSTLFVFPSLYEGFPNALAEAMVCKIPVVSSDCKSGPREILAPDIDCNKEIENIKYAKYGILTPIFDGFHYDGKDELSEKERQLANIIVRVIENKKFLKKYSKLSYERVNDFSTTNIIKEWENVL